MLKKVMFYLMLLLTAGKFFALTFLFTTDFFRLSPWIYGSTSIVIACGIILLCKSIIKSTSKKELAVFYGVLVVSVVFNLIFMKISSRAELNLIDLVVIGTVMDLLLSGTLLTLTMRESRYVRLSVK